MQLLLFIYLACVFQALFTRNINFLLVLLIIGLILGVILILVRIASTKRTKKLVLKVLDNPQAEIKPFVNANFSPWYIFQELPHIDRFQAKKIVWMRKHNGPYSSIEDFFKKNNITNTEQIKILSKMIKIR